MYWCVWAYNRYHVRHKCISSMMQKNMQTLELSVISQKKMFVWPYQLFMQSQAVTQHHMFNEQANSACSKRLIQIKTKLNWLEALGKEKELNFEDLQNIKMFIRSVIYFGKDGEDYVDTRIRLHKTLKNKSSTPLLPDPDSVIQVIKRAHCQDHLNLYEFGWSI